MTLRLVRRQPDHPPRGQEGWEVYDVMSGRVRIGQVARGNDSGREQVWGWSINIYIHNDGHGLPHGGPHHSREEAMEGIAQRWRLWLAAADLVEKEMPVDPPGEGQG